MADRYPLVVASGVVQELAFADNLNLSGSGITNTTSITCNDIFVQSGAIGIAASDATDNNAGANNIAIGRSASYLVGIMTGMNNIAIGYSSILPCTGGHDNIVLGVQAGQSLVGVHSHLGPSRITSEYNFFAGRSAGIRVTAGSRNAFIGLGAGAGVTTGNHNYCVGEDTMSLPCDHIADTPGDFNICLGNQAARNLTSGDSNVVIGFEAGKSNNGIGVSFIGSNNVLLGYRSGFVITEADNCVFVGPQSGVAATSGNFNTGVGYRALYALTSGDTNTAIGSSAGLNITTGTNNTCIGLAAVVSSATTSNQVVLGNQYVTDLRCNVTTISAISDARDKKDVVDLPIGLEFVNSLRPVKFEWDRRDGSMAGLKEAGFIAQELDAAQGAAGAEEYLRLVLKDNPDRLEASPGKLIPVLVKAIQELSARVAELEAK